MYIAICIAKYWQMTLQSTRNRMEIIFMILTINNNVIKLVENSNFFHLHKSDLHAIMSRLRGHLPIFGNKNLDVHLGGKGGQKEKKIH